MYAGMGTFLNTFMRFPVATTAVVTAAIVVPFIFTPPPVPVPEPITYPVPEITPALEIKVLPRLPDPIPLPPKKKKNG